MGNTKIDFKDITQDDIAQFTGSLGSTIRNFGSTKRDPRLGQNYDLASGGNGIAGAAGAATVELLDAISALADDGTIYNPYYRLGLYKLGGNLFDEGGPISGTNVLGAVDSIAKIASNAVGNSKLDMNPGDVNQAIRNYGNDTVRSLYSVSDNDALLNAYNNMAYLPTNVRARDYRNKTVLQDFTSSLASSFEGFNAGQGFGPVGAVIGGIVGGLASDFGIGAGRREAKRAARATNRLARNTNKAMDLAYVSASDRVDALNDRSREADYMNTIAYNALGGPLNTHGTDFFNGLTFIDNGGSHEGNPNGGVPVGVDREGTPNLVEEGEVIWDDYVFSNRIQVPEDLRKKYKLKKDATFADAARKLTEESLKRPNNPIDNETNRAILSELRGVQEDIRADIQAEELANQQEKQQEMEDLALMEALDYGNIQFPNAEQDSQNPFAFGGNLFPLGGYTRRRVVPTSVGPEGMTEEEERLALLEQRAMEAAAQRARTQRQAGSAFGSFKEGDYASNWNTFSREAVQNYARRQADAYKAAKTPEEKNRIRQETINTINLIQQGYGLSYDRSLGKTRVSNDPIVRKHQENWNARLNGNSGFGQIADAVNLPSGHNSGDDAAHGWVDGLWGPYTSIRNAGSSLSSQKDMQTLVDTFKEMGLDYSPTLDYGKDGAKLYLLSERQAPASARPTVDLNQYANDYTEDIIDEPLPQSAGERQQDNSTNSKIDLRKYAPAIFSGASALQGILGRPNYSNADAIIAAAREISNPVNIPVRMLGDYRKRRPFDERYLVNLANQRKVAAARSAMNTAGGNRAQQLAMSNLLAQTNQEGIGEIMRQAYLANRQDDAEVAAFNRGTNQYNASAINQRNLHQADLNFRRQAHGLSGITSGYGLRQNIRDIWDRTTAQNISNFAQQLANLYKDDYTLNQQVSAGNEGLFNGYNADDRGNITFSDLGFTYNPYTGEEIHASKGGTLKRKKRRF